MTAQDAAIDNAIIEGRITSEQVIREIIGDVKENKNLQGFYASRMWL